MSDARDFAPVDCAAIAGAAILLGHALQISSGFYEPAALAFAGAAAVCCLAALLRIPQRLTRRAGSERVVAFVLLAGVLWSLVELGSSKPAFYMPEPFSPPPLFAAAIATAIAAALLISFDSRRTRRLWFHLALAACGALGIWLIRASPRPHIDVLSVYSAALYALREGHSPYSVSFANLYGGAGYYAADMATGSQVQFGFPYPPLALLLAIPGKAVGDIRYADLAGSLIGGAAIAYAGRGRVAPLASMMLLFTPRSLFVLEQGWSEPLVICWLGLVMLAATRRRPLAVPLGLLLGVKQHVALALLFAPWLQPDRTRADSWRLIAKAIAIAAAVTLPFVVWDPHGFWRSVVALQFREPFRLDSLSVVAALGQAGWAPPPIVLLAVPMTALAAGVAIAWRFAPRTPSGFAVSLGFVLLLLFLFSKKAFCNYYYLVIAAFSASVACCPGVEHRELEAFSSGGGRGAGHRFVDRQVLSFAPADLAVPAEDVSR